MVDFKKRLQRSTAKPVDPIELYASLDLAHDKGELRETQRRVLETWHQGLRTRRDVLLKLHTGQGKTLVGLLMLQSKLNQGSGPAVYLCPNRFLVRQTIEQARQFGIACVEADEGLPEEFLTGQSILVGVVHKLFNGQTKFGLSQKSIPVGTILLDDAHACADSIQDQCTITIRHDQPNEDNVYRDLRDLFETELRAQGDGSYEEIALHEPGPYLPVPYWAWNERTSDVAKILARDAKTITSLRMTWPLLKDTLRHTLCLVSGKQIKISPYQLPLALFGSFHKAPHRIFMSATVADDAFLVKGLGLSDETILNPLVDPSERWSGEKMVLMPSLIDPQLDRGRVVELLAKPGPSRRFGFVALVPSAKRCADWAGYGADVVDKTTIEDAVTRLRNRDFSKTVVVANYYDGVDLPDDTCRVLVLDSKPFAEELLDRYTEDRRHNSRTTLARLARTIEQGMGRAVRGPKDYCVVILIGPDLVHAIQDPGQRDLFSDQTRTQLKIGREIVSFAKEEIAGGTDATKAMATLLRQCTQRDSTWKDYYAEQMDRMAATPDPGRSELLKTFRAEAKAEALYQDGKVDEAVATIQSLLDGALAGDSDRGFYLQEMARFQSDTSRTASEGLQASAHSRNKTLLRPRTGFVVTRVKTLTPERRLERIATWISAHENYEALSRSVDATLADLAFGVDSDRFEEALRSLATAIGLESDRPDKEWKEGPDNLWGLRDNEYLIFEAKNMVESTRAEINKRESEQMNRSSAWFAKHYSGATVTRLMIIPTKKVASEAHFLDPVLIMTRRELQMLTKNTRSFFNEFRLVDLKDLSRSAIDARIRAHQLGTDDLSTKYGVRPAERRS